MLKRNNKLLFKDLHARGMITRARKPVGHKLIELREEPSEKAPSSPVREQASDSSSNYCHKIDLFNFHAAQTIFSLTLSSSKQHPNLQDASDLSDVEPCFTQILNQTSRSTAAFSSGLKGLTTELSSECDSSEPQDLTKVMHIRVGSKRNTSQLNLDSIGMPSCKRLRSLNVNKVACQVQVCTRSMHKGTLFQVAPVSVQTRSQHKLNQSKLFEIRPTQD